MAPLTTRVQVDIVVAVAIHPSSALPTCTSPNRYSPRPAARRASGALRSPQTPAERALLRPAHQQLRQLCHSRPPFQGVYCRQASPPRHRRLPTSAPSWLYVMLPMRWRYATAQSCSLGSIRGAGQNGIACAVSVLPPEEIDDGPQEGLVLTWAWLWWMETLVLVVERPLARVVCKGPASFCD